MKLNKTSASDTGQTGLPFTNTLLVSPKIIQTAFKYFNWACRYFIVRQTIPDRSKSIRKWKLCNVIVHMLLCISWYLLPLVTECEPTNLYDTMLAYRSEKLFVGVGLSMYNILDLGFHVFYSSVQIMQAIEGPCTVHARGGDAFACIQDTPSFNRRSPLNAY